MDALKAILDGIFDFTPIEVEGPPIGEGSFGQVFRVQDAEGGIYALKTTPYASREPGLAQEIITCFFQEVFNQIVAAHPCINRLDGWNVYQGAEPALCLLTPFYEKGTLTSNLPSLTPGQKTIIAYGVARALRHLQSKFNIVHGDIKADNIFLEDKEGFTVILGDVGFIKVKSRIEHSVRAGTANHIAPELLTEDGRPDCALKADVYSYAILIATLIEGSPVTFDPEVFQGVYNPELTDFGTILKNGARPQVSSASQSDLDWLARLWATEPADRPSFPEICQELEQREHWFAGYTPDDEEEFDKFRVYLDTTEFKESQSRRLAADEDPPDWLQKLEEKPDNTSPDFILSVLSAASDGDLEASKYAAMVYLAGSPEFKQSTLKAVQFALKSADPLLATLTKAGPGIDPWHRGQILEASGRVAEAAIEYKKAAEEGNAEALWRWGSLLVDNDLGLHFKEGIALLEKAAATVSDAAFDLAMLYLSGRFVPMSKAKGIEWLERAIDLGHKDAALQLAVIHHLDFDFKEAYRVYCLAKEDFDETEVEEHINFLQKQWLAE
jgi:serine/threonine protein kinase